MLTALHIQDFVLIDALALPLETGMTVLTGETGAGKSILLEALGLAVGVRSARGGVRKGAQKGVVTAAFDPPAPHPVWRVLEENGISIEDDQIILRRVQNADGRGRAFINDQPVSIGLLREIGAALLEIHGQHDGRGFLTASTHRDLLDEFGRLTPLRRQVETAWSALRQAVDHLEARQREDAETAREADYLSHIVKELADLNPMPDEETALADRRAALMAAEKMTDDLTAATRALSEDGVSGKLQAAAHRLNRAAMRFDPSENPLSDALEKIDRALSEVMEADAAVALAGERLGFDPDELERVEERLFSLRAAARKHGVQPAALQDLLEKASAALAKMEQSAADMTALEKAAAAARKTFQTKAQALSDKRVAAGALLDKAVSKELAPLKLNKAIFRTHIKNISVDERHKKTTEYDDGAEPSARTAGLTENTVAGWGTGANGVMRGRAVAGGPDGIDHVEFMVATNAGAELGPIKTIASGGELSRFILAMKAALAVKENRTVIIFDEVDAGVGGAVADAVGERLALLARDAQVLVVTHSPQVAARANTHWVVEKEELKNETRTTVRSLDASERVEEIARMLSGAHITAEARAAAARLLGAPSEQDAAAKRPRRKRKAG